MKTLDERVKHLEGRIDLLEKDLFKLIYQTAGLEIDGKKLKKLISDINRNKNVIKL